MVVVGSKHGEWDNRRSEEGMHHDHDEKSQLFLFAHLGRVGTFKSNNIDVAFVQHCAGNDGNNNRTKDD